MSLQSNNENAQIPPASTAAGTTGKKSVLTAVIIIGAVVLLTAAVVISALLISTQGKKEQKYAYIKDASIYISANGAKGEPITLSGLASDVSFSENKDRIFWINGSSLFYADTVGTEYKYEKISENADEDYVIDKSGNTVVYMTNDNELYRYSVADGESEKIGTNVYYYENSPDLSRIAFISKGYELYIKNGSDEVTKIVGSDDTLRWYGNDNLDTIVYLDEITLCKWELASGKSETIDTNVTGIAPVCFYGNKAKAFYTKANSTSVKYWDYVNDDLADSDAAVQEPIKPTKPANSLDDNKASSEYEKAYNKYLEDYQKYSDKLSRDELRKELNETEYSFYSNDLYFYNGNNTEKKLTKLLDRAIQSAKALPYPAVEFFRHEDKPETSAKINMSEIGTIYDVGAFIGDNYNDTLWIDNIEIYFASEKTVTELFPDREMQYCILADDGSAVYCMVNENTQEHSLSLYKISLLNGAIVGTKKIASDLNERYMEIKGSNRVLYLKYLNEDRTECEVYIDEYLIDDNIILGLIGCVVLDNDNAFYFTDYDSKSGMGTLKCRQLGGDARIIKENVSEFQVYDDGSVLFISDKTADGTGELYLCKGTEVIKLDEGVTGIAKNYAKPGYGSYIKLYT